MCMWLSELLELLAPSDACKTLYPEYVCMLSRVLTLCNPMNCSPPGSSVHRISQARILEWFAIFSSRGSS